MLQQLWSGFARLESLISKPWFTFRVKLFGHGSIAGQIREKDSHMLAHAFADGFRLLCFNILIQSITAFITKLFAKLVNGLTLETGVF